MHRAQLTISTPGRSIQDITRTIRDVVDQSGIHEGLCHVFVQHTSASLLIQENADPDVRGDLERWMSRLVQDGDAIFRHTDEGPDDMSAHIRSVLTATSLTVPVVQGRLALGTWQGLYLWEHRARPHRRRLIVTVS